MRKLGIFFFYLFFAVLITQPFLQISGSGSELLNDPTEMKEVLPSLLSNLNWTRIRTRIEFFEGLGSRFTGYHAYYEAREYIVSEFQRLGLTVLLENYSTVIPYDYGAWLNITSPTRRSIRLYPLLPNLLCPPSTPYLTGPLIYIGKGDFEEIEGKAIDGSIVLMDFNSHRNWLNTILLGAKAIVFVEPLDTTVFEAESKVVSTPINIPRFYVKRSDAEWILEMLKDKKVSGEITSLMQWETKIASNIVGILNGTTLGEEAVSLWAFFDSSSIVPSLAPGADAASGISVLLELARILSENRPARTIIFTALSGHFQSLLGAREFVDKYMFTDKGRNILLTIGLDLSTDSNSMALYYGGRSFYSPGFDPERFYRVAELLFYLGTRREFPDERYRDMNVGDQSLLGVLMATTRQIYYVGDGLLQTGGRFVQRLASVPTGLMIDTEPLAMANGMALSFSTSGSYRSRWETPFDTLEYWKLENLKPQAEFILSALYLLANIRNLRGWVPETTLTRFDPIHALGFSTLKGRVMEYDQMKGVYAPVPNALVYAEAFLFRHRLIALANDNGEFEMIGLRPQTEYSVKAYLIDSKTGNPVYAPDMGQYAVTFANSFTVSREKELKTFIVFKAGSIGLPGITEPRSKETSITFSIYDASSHAMPFSYGYDLGSPFTLTEITPSSLETSVSVIFAPPWEPVEITTEIGGKIFGVINNGSIGYKVEAGKLVLIPMLPLQMAREMHRLNSERLGIVHEYGIFSAGGFAESFLAKGRFMIEQALTALNDQRYGEAYSHSIDAWINEANAYLEIKNLITDVASTIVFLGLILAPFSLSAERLFIHSQKGPVRFTVTFLFFSLPLMLLYFIHPGFVLASNAFMAVLGAGVLVLNVPVIAMLLTESLGYASQIKEKLMGHHTLAASKVSTFLLALSTGIESMRKRKLRTGFTLITIMMIVFSLTSLTSLYATRSTVVIPSPVGKALYDGLLLRMPRWEQLTRELYRDMQLKFGKDAAVSPRAWWFPNFYESPRLFLRGSTEVLALWGLMPEEEEVSGLWSRARIDGRWLTENDSWVCIVSDDVSKGTHMTLGDEVELLGFRFTVVGIINGTIAASLSDMDGESITPVNFEMVKPEIEEFPHLSSSFIIIPFQTLLKMGGQCYSIAIKFKEYISISVKEVASELIFSTPTDIYVTSQGGTSIYRVGGVFIFGGAESFVILTALAILILFDAVLGNLYEKTKEIPIYSSLGLSPTGVGGMHLVENLIHAFIGGFIGYMGGVLGIRFFQLLEVIPPGISINLYGSVVIISVLAAMATVVIASVYPFFKASKMVTPSLERKWRISSPSGDVWVILLPFKFQAEETRSVLAFLKEYFEAHSQEGIGRFILRGSLSQVSEEKVMALEGQVSLSPYEQGVNQKLTLRASSPDGKNYDFEIKIVRLTGMYSLWRRLNYSFVDGIRKQFLVWRTLPPSERERYGMEKRIHTGGERPD